jgi:hypothetical protein
MITEVRLWIPATQPMTASTPSATTGGDDHVESTARAQVQDDFTGFELSQ